MEKPNGDLGVLARALICLSAIRHTDEGSRQRHVRVLIERSRALLALTHPSPTEIF